MAMSVLTNADDATLRSLAGWRVLVTRARAQASQLSDALRLRGATVLELPTIEIVPAPVEPLDDAITCLGSYDWMLFTSANAVNVFFDRMDALGRPIEHVGHVSVGAIGRSTARRLIERGVDVDFVPHAFVAESMVAGMSARGVADVRVLLPQAEIARDTLAEGLRAAGAVVDVVVTYRTQLPTALDRDVVEKVRAGDLDAATFASPSAVRNLCELIGGPLPPHVAVAAIGPITATAIVDCEMRVDVQPDEHSMEELVSALATYASAHPPRVAGS